MEEIINKIGLDELIEKKSLNDEDIILIQDSENTKKVSFRNLRSSLIDDNELPSENRMYSSYKLDQAIQEFQNQLDYDIGKVQNSVDNISKDYITESKLDKKIKEFGDTVSDIAEVDKLKSAIEGKRDSSVLITSSDLSTASDEDKIQAKNLSKEVLSMMTGSTPVSTPSVPTGGWVQEDIAEGAINAIKLSKQYRYRGYYSEANINQFTQDGLYLLGFSVTGLPKMSDTDNEDRLLEVTNYGPDQYIIQKVSYCTDSTDTIRPIYIRKAYLNQLSTTDFIAEYSITDTFKIERNILKDDILYCGVLESGSIYDITVDGDYYAKKGVSNLPDNVHDFTVSIRNYGSRVEYSAKIVNYDLCEIYISNTYLTSSNLKKYTEWYKTNTVKKSKLQGKTLHLFGDGVCFGLGSSNIPVLSYPSLLNSRYGININNHALGDATIGVYDDEFLEERSVIKQIESAVMSDGDMAIIFAGSNDYKSGIAKIGSNTDFTSYSFKGALNTCIKNLLTKKPSIKLLIVSPIFRARLSADDFRNSDETPINELYLSDYVKAMKDISEYNHIPFLDLHSTSMINKYNFTYYLKDRFYLNDSGHDMIADKIFSALSYYY